ncbi:hypothetical protein VTO42DRAFT_6494 [Malbranchea cinnamomea]
MKVFPFSSLGLYGLSLAAVWRSVHAQLGSYTDPTTGITFSTWSVSDSQTNGGFMWGWALPPDAETVDATEYIGIIVGAINNGGGYAGVSHGGGMPSALLLAVWPNEDDVVTSFRFASGYVDPELYAGDATLTPFLKSVNETHYTIIYRCENCWSWDHNGVTGSRSTTEGVMVLGWAQAYESPSDPADPDSTVVQHDTQGMFGAPVASAVSEQYSEWANLPPVDGPTPTETETETPTATPEPTVTGIPVPTDTFDYIVVGSGAGGIPIADRLSEVGKSVLLIEKGPPSSYRWGGRIRPDWLADTNLTRFDVPGLCNEIWVDSAGIACNDVAVMAGCVVGGGTAVNSGLWWRAPARDWDENFPDGWKSGDMKGAVDKVFARIPGSDIPSMDGKRYLQQGYEVIAGALRDAHWVNVTANDHPDDKQRTFSYTPFMFSGGERGGPMATYLVTASQRDNFKLWMNTMVRRVIREGGHITGVEVEPVTEDGYRGIVNVTPGTGRVILSAGTFGTPKILFRSGIGPQDMLEIVNSSTIDGGSMISSDQWINLPVGYNLVDHVNTDVVVTHPDVVFYDFYAAFDDPIPEDRDAYLEHRSGVLAMAAPNIGPMFWESIPGKDGVNRQLQWQARIEGALGERSEKAITISQYLGTGSTSRGRLAITSSLTMTVAEHPYLHDQNDIDAVVAGIEHLQEILSKVPDLTWSHPAPDESAVDYVKNYPVSPASRSANHWMGSCKMGKDDGRKDGGTAVVDLNTKVYGTDNLFVVDASIFPGMVTTNPSALIVSVSERAAEKILALS